jgi:quinohemoprotein amine dehydrogenase beta subunit
MSLSDTARRSARFAFLALLLTAGAASAKDYLVTGVRPGKLVVIDAAARQVVHTHTLPNSSPGNGPATILISPDKRIAYVLHNRWESISGIDLDSGAEVFRADLGQPGVRMKSTLAIALHPSGKELAVHVSPVKLLPGEYQVQEPYIAIYDTAAGIAAKPTRTLPASRRTTTLFYSPDASRLYAMSWDIQVLDPQDGRVIGKHPVRHWGRQNLGEPDALTLWPQWGAANVFSFPYFVARTDKKPGDPAALQAGIFTLDMATDKVAYKEFENASVVLFSSAVNPVRRNEVFAVYTQLSKVDMNAGKLVKRIDLDHTYYAIGVATDGKELYTAGAGGDISVYDTKTLKRLGKIEMPGLADQSAAALQIVSRP